MMVMVEDKGGAFPIARVVERQQFKRDARKKRQRKHHCSTLQHTHRRSRQHGTGRPLTARTRNTRGGSHSGGRHSVLARALAGDPDLAVTTARHLLPAICRPPPQHATSLTTTGLSAPSTANIISTSYIIHCGVMNVHINTVMISLSNMGQSIRELVLQVIVCRESLGSGASSGRPTVMSCNHCCFVRKASFLFSPSV